MLWYRLRFPLKLTFAILLALFVGFEFNLETPRWAVMTAAIVGGEPPSLPGAIRFPALCVTAGCCASSAPLLAVLPRW